MLESENNIENTQNKINYINDKTEEKITEYAFDNGAHKNKPSLLSITT